LSITHVPGDGTDWMDYSDTQSPHTLTDDEMGRLVCIALEQFGAELPRTQFNEMMLALFEHIAGLESLPTKRRQRYLQLLWLKYQQAILANQHAH
jgi:hypothetical protein